MIEEEYESRAQTHGIIAHERFFAREPYEQISASLSRYFELHIFSRRVFKIPIIAAGRYAIARHNYPMAHLRGRPPLRMAFMS